MAQDAQNSVPDGGGRNCKTHLRGAGRVQNVGRSEGGRKCRIVYFSANRMRYNRRYTECPILCVPYGSLQGVTVRPVPCNYYVIQQDVALSRRKRGFKSRRGRQVN